MTSYSNTRLTTFRRCRLKYHLTYVDPVPQKDSLALRRGHAAHVALAKYYSGSTIKEAAGAAWADYAPQSDEAIKRMHDLDHILVRYFNWAAIYDQWKVLAVERTVEASYNGIKLMGIWDLLVNRQGKNYIVDHKFQKSHQTSNLEVDSQVSHYLALAHLLGIEVFGLIYNIVNLETGNTEKVTVRATATRQKYFIKAYLDSLLPQIKEIKKADKKKLEIYPNWTKDCCWDCGFYRQCVDSPFQTKKA